MKFKSVFCKCVTVAKPNTANVCKCFVAKLKCSSRCHKSNTANANAEFNKLMLFVRKDQYSATKFKVATKLYPVKTVLTFTDLIQHFLLLHMRYIEESSCDNLFCPQKRSVREMSNVTTLEFNSTAATNWISPDEFQRQIVSYTIPEDCYFVDRNTTTG